MAVFDPAEWVRALDAAKVEYVLVGGYAGVLHGAGRPTLDIDIVPRWETRNLERLGDLLRPSTRPRPPAPPSRATPSCPRCSSNER